MAAPSRVVVIGAGMSGLVAATELTAAGATVLVVDKGRSVGGRLATRRIGDAVVDHGAQFFTVRTPAFERRVDAWQAEGVVSVWNRGFANSDGHPRYVGTSGMNSIAKHLARGVTVEIDTMAFAVRPGRGPSRWDVVIDDGTTRPADAVILTCPLPQSFALLVDSGVELDESLFRVEYDRTLALLTRLSTPGAVPEPGGLQDPDEVFSFIGDNTAKGVSPVPAITFHAAPDWSAEHWDDDHDDIRRGLLEAAAPYLGDARPAESQLKKWRFATPRTPWPDPCWIAGQGTIVVAGDAFAGPRVEGAHNSGLAAAHTLLA